ncbi:MAG: FAD-linked oxidase C-terminal domain-containing protein [Candidatus Krumholzibacteriia bacterium]
MNERVRRELRRILAAGDILEAPALRALYESDSQRLYRRPPELVLFPRSSEQCAAIAKLAGEEGVPVTPRGAGTGLSGGAVPLEAGLLISFTRMREVLSWDAEARRAWVQPGLVNRELQELVAPSGLHFAPDPSSQTVSTLGGNLAENAGGPHCFKIGVMTQHVLALELVDDRGELHRLGCGSAGGDPLDAAGLITGSEGTLGLVTALELELTPLPERVATLLAPYASLETACAVVGELLDTGLRPAAVEILDAEAIRAVEGSVFRAGYPAEAQAVLLVELSGLPEQVEDERAELTALLTRRGALWLQEASDPAERKRLWRGRKGAFGALGRLYRDIVVQDICVPISRLPEAIRRVGELAAEQQLPVANVFHAGDGNLHPNIGFDREDPSQLRRLHRLIEGTLDLAVELGGTLSGEHGIGVEKAFYLPRALSPDDREPLLRLKKGLDPRGVFNPGKIFPAGDLRAGGHPLRVVTTPAGSASEGEGESRLFRPESVDELVRLLEDRTSRGKLLYPTGARLLDELPPLPGPAQWILSTASLRGVLDHSRADFQVEVAAGTPWTELADFLAGEERELDWQVSLPEHRSVGGVVACDESWPWRGGQRSPRDRLLGASGLLSDGTPFEAGGRVVKNVTGYDLCRLLAGSRGALALMAAVRLRTRPRVELRRRLVLGYRDRQRALAAGLALFRRTDAPAGQLLVAPALALDGLEPAYHLVLGLEGRSRAVAEQDAHVLALLAQEGLLPRDTAREDGESGPWLAALRDFPWTAPAPPDLRAGLRELRGPLPRLVDLLPELGPRWVLDFPGRRLRAARIDDGGQGPTPRGPVLLRQADPGPRGAEGQSRFLGLAGATYLERVARALDPEARLAAGRWLFG